MILGLIALAVVSSAGTHDIPVEAEWVEREMDWEWLTYCNGTPGWLSWGGTYRGTWFNLEDFFPGVTTALVSEVELWFFHSSSYPWDTSDAFVELWEGCSYGPGSELDQQIVTAQHLTPVYIYYDPPIEVPGDFWVLVNIEMSAGGWPSILGDNSAEPVPHSFYSDDFIVWEPWYGRNYFVAVLAEFDDLGAISWGELKSMF